MRRIRPLYVAVAVVGLTGAWLGCEWMKSRSEAAMVTAHLAYWDCLVKSDSTLPQCRELVARGKASEDANRCEAAVAACQANGAQARMEGSERDFDGWRRPTAVFRLAMLGVALGGVLGAVLTVGLRWVRRSRGGAA